MSYIASVSEKWLREFFYYESLSGFFVGWFFILPLLFLFLLATTILLLTLLADGRMPKKATFQVTDYLGAQCSVPSAQRPVATPNMTTETDGPDTAKEHPRCE